VYDHPDLIALVVVGDGESETDPLAISWHQQVSQPWSGTPGSAAEWL
jgi:phosphoketolase